jgi:hypothetical protein
VWKGQLCMSGKPLRILEPIKGWCRETAVGIEQNGAGISEPLVGFEPTTARLRIESSTPELQWRDVGCPGADSNRDAFRHYPLKIACLPVSPPGRARRSKIAAGK